MTRVAIAEGLFTESDGAVALLGGRCEHCGTVSFPVVEGCPRCSATEISPVSLPPRGRLWTWTSQEFRPKSPPYAGPGDDTNFQPYYVGYVQLEGGLRVESYLTGIEGRSPEIGEELELVIVPFNRNEAGDQIVTYAFAPLRAPEQPGKEPT